MKFERKIKQIIHELRKADKNTNDAIDSALAKNRAERRKLERKRRRQVKKAIKTINKAINIHNNTDRYAEQIGNQLERFVHKKIVDKFVVKDKVKYKTPKRPDTVEVQDHAVSLNKPDIPNDNQQPKTTMAKLKVKVWDENAWGKGRGGNKEIRETISKEEYDVREKFIDKYNNDIDKYDLKLNKLDQSTLKRVMHNRKVTEVKDLQLDARDYYQDKKDRGVFNLLNVITTSNRYNTDLMDLIVDRIYDHIDDLGKYFENYELVDLYESGQDKMSNTYTKFVTDVLKYDLDDDFNGKTVREILREAGVSNV